MRTLLRTGAVTLTAMFLAACGTTTAPAPSSTPVSTPPPPTSSAPSNGLTAGMSVFGNRTGDQWYSATVVSVNGSTTTVRYTDGVTDNTALADSKIALAPTGPQPAKVGDVVVAKWTTTWWRAEITEIDGVNVSVRYSDNTTGSMTTSDITRPIGGTLPKLDPAPVIPSTPAVSLPSGPEPVATAEEPFPVGMTVLGNWSKGQAWYPGRISAASAGTYSMAYNDGSKEDGLTRNDLAHFPGGPLSVKAGDKVIGEWRPATWWTATVVAVNGDMVDIKYSDDTTGTLKSDKLAQAGK